MIRKATVEDAEAIVRIYNHYIEGTEITFETKALSASEMGERIGRIGKDYPWICFEENGRVLGYAYAASWGERNAYRYSTTGTVYLDHEMTGRGIGKRLYTALLDLVKEAGFHCVIGRISLPNDPSVRLHEELGFKKVAHIPEVGRKFDRWIDVGYWQFTF